MGKKSGKTKSGRIMNPADRERKKQRAQELKKNKKQRTQVRHAIVKAKDAEEILAQLRRLDDQDLDPNSEFSKHVIAEKRAKCKAVYLQQLALYRQEKDENQVTRLENMLQAYESERRRKEQQYQALMFSNDMNLSEIPLPSGSMMPDAAMTPFITAPPVPPQFTTPEKSETKKETKASKRRPPGPPCGVPPSFADDVDVNRPRRTQYLKPAEPEPDLDDYDVDDDDMGPVTIPDELMPDKPSFQPVRAMVSAPIIPPNMAPPPPPVPPVFNGPPQNRYDPVMPPMAAYNNVPQLQMNRPRFDPKLISAPPSGPSTTAQAVISAAPQMRNFKKETTRFVPAALQVRRPTTQPKPKPINRDLIGGQKLPQQNQKAVGGRSVDETCEDFLREISDLL